MSSRLLGQLEKPIAREMYRALAKHAVESSVIVWAQSDFLIVIGRKNDTASRTALKELQREGYIHRDRYTTQNGGQGKLVVLTSDFLNALGISGFSSDYPF